jgi:hypothetical protein
MTNTLDNTPADPELPSPAETSSGPVGESPPTGSPFTAPSRRLTACLAAAMLAVGVVVGAAIGPAPQSSLAGPPLPALMSLLAARAAASRQVTSASVAPPAVVATATPRVRHRRRRHHLAAAEAAAPTSETPTPAPTSPAKPVASKKATLAPVSKVWLIQLSGSTFTEVLAHASSAPYLATQAIPAGALLSEWSGIEGSAFAGDAALIAGPAPQVLDTIVQPACPEGAAGVACATGTPGALTAADEFLKATVPTITSLAPFRENGLIVVTFASVTAGAASGLPAGTTTATLTAEPPAGVLLISPFATAGSKPSTPFTPAVPTKSIEKLLHR